MNPRLGQADDLQPIYMRKGNEVDTPLKKNIFYNCVETFSAFSHRGVGPMGRRLR